MKYRLLRREWPIKKKRVFWLGMLFELLILIPLLVIFGIAQPNTWRTKMWEIGYENGWNSDPRMIIYAAANYEPRPAVPFVWSQLLTDLNVAISIVSVFSLLLRMVFYIMEVYYPIFSVVVHTGLVAVWTLSLYGQMGPDHADERYPSKVAWYIARSCDAAGGRFRAVRECQMSKAAFGVTVVMLVVLLLNYAHAIWAMVPTPEDKKGGGSRRGRRRNGDDSDDDYVDDDESGGSSPVDPKAHRGKRPMTQSSVVEMTTMSGAGARMPASPRFAPPPNQPGAQQPPFTPRTMAFQQLDRKLPLRQQYG